MRAQTARWVAGCIAAGSVALIVAGLVLAYVDRHSLPAGQNDWNLPEVFGQVVNLAVPVVGFVLASRRPANRIGWVFLAAGLSLGLSAFSLQYALHALVAAPGSLPAGRAFAWLSNWTWVIPFAMLAFLFLLFPTGRLCSRRWRPAAWFVGAVFAATVVDMVVRATRLWQDPFGSFTEAETPAELIVLLFLIVAALVISVAAVVVRYARSAGDERLQLKWFAAAALLVVATFIPSFLTTWMVAGVLSNLAFLCLWTAIGIAVLKYRLYDIDIVISKAVLYGSLAVFITAVYAALVVGVGALVGNRRNALLAALAAAVVAVAFQPARQRAGRLANRIVYGRRATPYQVLSDFAQRIGGAYAHEDVLPRMAQIVAAGTGAEQVVVWLRVDDELRPEASSGDGPDAAPVPVDGQAMPPLPRCDLCVPVVHQGELLGAISIRMPKGEPLRSAGKQLVADVASQAGLVLSNAGLIEDLRASRQRIVAAQDEARRRLERNIHDGAQQDLVALAIKLRLAGTTVDEDPAQTKELLGELQADASGALENLRDLARGIYPPLLADLGLAAALSAQASKSPLPVTVDADGIGRFPQDTEAAVYFCCLEALQNTAKYAQASSAQICLQAHNGTLRFTVSDDGAGYDVGHTPMGSGQRNMADRLAALGGSLEVRSAPSRGTTITACLPCAPGAAHGTAGPG
ncbi:MAG TPA: histidine kinase [Streptosporangiaceae bacterium]|jgi:signal transduction histidine kinase|nr:histidine kinase [Streptosporangiaceae bacterium]